MGQSRETQVYLVVYLVTLDGAYDQVLQARAANKNGGANQRAGSPRKEFKQNLKSVSTFRAKILLLIHLTGGQLARITELLSVRHRNTPIGEHRNLLVKDGLVITATRYHKGYNRSEEVELIHRYLSISLSNLVILYLWSVLPVCIEVSDAELAKVVDKYPNEDPTVLRNRLIATRATELYRKIMGQQTSRRS